MFSIGNKVSKYRRRALALVGIGFGLAVVLSGCSAAPTTPAADDAPVKIRVIEANLHDPTILGAEAGDFLDIWSECSPAVDVKVNAGEKVAEAVAANSADIGIASPNRVIGAISQGLDASIIGASTPVWDQFLIVSSDNPAKSIEDLEGSAFGISSFGSAGHYATEKMARTEGWSADEFEIVTMGSIDGIKAGLTSGTVQAFLWSAQTAFGLELAGDAKVLGNVRELVGENAMNVLFASNKILEEHPAAVKSFAECYYKAVDAIQSDEKLATDLFVGDWDIDPRVAARVIADELPLLSTDGVLTDGMLEGMLEATHFTIESSKDVTFDDVKAMYKPWADL